MISPSYKIIFTVSICLFLWGCTTTVSKEKLAKAEAELALKKTQITDLLKQIRDNTLQKGDPLSDIEKRFGKPDDVFHSGSTDSSLEVWTYEQIIVNPEAGMSPIRLYFNDGKLTGWNY